MPIIHYILPKILFLSNHVISIFIYLQIQQFVIMKKPFHGVEKTLEEGWKMNLNNCLKISSYFMVFVWLIASYIILLFEFGEILDHDIGSSPNWHCAVWPLVGSKLKCLNITSYAIELSTATINSILLVLLAVGMLKRKYMFMMPWIIFRFTTMLVSFSPFKFNTKGQLNSE